MSSAKLLNACQGKSANQGGMNLPEIKELAKSMGHSGVGKREDLIKVICTVMGKTTQVAQVAQKKQMNEDERLRKACAGFGTAMGGMNTDEIRKMAGSPKTGSREDLLRVICKDHPILHPLAKAMPPPVKRGAVKDATKQWNEVRKPQDKKSRVKLIADCGAKCFLRPDELKYPICAKDGDCSVDCDGIRAAYGVTSILFNSPKINMAAKSAALEARSKAANIAKEHCGWIDE